MLSEKDQLEFNDFVDYTRNFYRGGNQTMSDAEWDSKRKYFEVRLGKSIMTFIDFGSDKIKIPHRKDSIFQVNKITLKGKFKNEVEPIFKNTTTGKWFYKNDGCSIVLYYHNGYFQRAATKSSEEVGIDKTLDLMGKVPNRVDPEITLIRCEAMVSVKDVSGPFAARSKANGMINSEHLQSEVDEKICLRALHVGLASKPWRENVEEMLEYMRGLPTIKDEKTGHVVFAPNREIEWSDVTDDIIQTPESDRDQFIFDGLVHYDTETNRVIAYKIHTSDIQPTTIRTIEWNKSEKSSWIPKALYDSVKLGATDTDEDGNLIGGVNNDRATCNGVDELIRRKMGVGAFVGVGLGGTTIPQIIEVMETSEDYQFPTCSCGHKLTMEDKVGPSLKCCNPTCSERLQERTDNFWNNVNQRFNGDWEDWISEDPYNFLQSNLNIDRVNLEKKLGDVELDYEELMGTCYSLMEGEEEKVLAYLKRYVSFTELSTKIFSINFNAVSKIKI